MVSGTPNLKIQPLKKLLTTILEVISRIGITSGHLVK
uniref:Uncharacterized protein n=1 Tax=Lepeophtheirus salmonis TaxID=72036 RepID=A0A0K2UCD3_LEPSM